MKKVQQPTPTPLTDLVFRVSLDLPFDQNVRGVRLDLPWTSSVNPRYPGENSTVGIITSMHDKFGDIWSL